MNKLAYTSLCFFPFLIFSFLGKKDSYPHTSIEKKKIVTEDNLALESTLLVTPFSCPSTFFQTFTGSGTNGNFATYDLDCQGDINSFNVFSTFGFNVNATGYNPVDNYIYTINKSNDHLLQIQADGSYIDLGSLPLTTNPVAGGFDPNGILFVKTGNSSPIDRIDVSNLTVTTVDPGVNFNAKDWSYHYLKNKFYGVHNGGGNGLLYSYDPAANVVESFPISGLQAADGPTFGASFYSSDGFIYVVNNNTGNLYRIDVDANEANFVIQGAIPDTGSDGAACPFALPPVSIIYAEPDVICTSSGVPTSIMIHSNDNYHLLPGLDFSSFSILSPPSFGTINYSSGNLTYTSTGNAQADVLTYQICGTDNCGLTVCDYADVVINPATNIPTFTIQNTYCEGESTDPLPNISNNNISGNWSPSIISNTNSGSYIFTPNTGECAEPFTLNVSIQNATIPTFNIQNTYCEGESTDPLLNISNNNISGNWSPNIISNTNSGSYIFTPNTGECAEPFTLNVSILQQIIITQETSTCSNDLLTYDLDFSIVGGSGFYNNVIAGAFNVVDNGGGNYTIEGIPSGDNTTISITDNENCTAILVTNPQDCSCPTIAAPTNPVDNIFCFGENLTSISVDDAPTGFQINWYNNGTFVSNDNPFTPSQAGTFTATHQEITTGCESTPVSVTLSVSTPDANAGSDQTITCQNSQATLQGSGTNAIDFSWTSSNGFTSTSQNPIVTEAGIYFLTTTNADGCTASDDVEVIFDYVVPLASANASENIDCETACVTLNGVSSLSDVTFTWSGPDPNMDINSPNPEVCVPGIYELIVTINGTNCISSPTSVEVIDNSANISAAVNTQSACEENQGSISFASTIGGTSPYLFSIDNGNTFVTNNNFTNLSAGSYDVVVQDTFGCEYFETVIVPYPSELEVAIEPLVEIELGDSYQLTPQLNISPQLIDTLWWTPEDSLSCTDCLNPIASPIFSTNYQITVVDENGCSDEAIIQVIVNRELDVFVPNAFSPNGDGSNDRFTLFTDQGVKEIETLQIFDRWGEIVFTNNNFPPNDLQFGWDGKFKGKDLNHAVFAYFAKIKMADGRTEIVQGDITITK